jgi:hypothetical protein
MRPTLELLGELAEQTRSLVQVELSLLRAELRERGASISSSLTKVGVGLIFLPIGLTLIFVAIRLALRRFGIPVDLAFLIVALVAVAAGSFALVSGLRGLKPARLAPSKSISQISSLLGEFQDGADVRWVWSPGKPVALANGRNYRQAAFKSHALNLASEAASRVGVSELSWRGALDFASTRHPGPTAIAGFGVALWLLAAARKRNKEGVHEVTLPLRESSSSLVDTATRVFRERAATKQREFIGATQTQVAKGAAILSDAIEDKLEDVMDRAPGGSQVRPLIESTVQMALAAALEALLQRRSRNTSR